jgi:predicted dehydrogenase/nucleoside-diphosphate-sugar epimerase
MKRAIKSLRVGFVGTGYIADWHAKALSTAPGASLVAVCDKDLPRARAFGKRYSVARCYESLENMIADKELGLDSVHVLLPPDLHARAACALIDAGLHVLLEKPMATTALECARLIDRAATRGVLIGVNHNFLFAPIYETLKNDLGSGKLGRPDHVTIIWNRGLDQLQSGPFNLWMLRDPRNIVLEIGPHCVAPMLDLVGPLDIAAVRASNPLDLPGNRKFYRRWHVEAETGPVAATLTLSFAPGFTEQLIHIRGTLASATVDFERNTYLLRQHTRYGLDFDRYRMIRDEAVSLAAQARATLTQYALSKLKLSTKGSPYGLSIARAVQAFYTGLGEAVDPRLSPELGRDIVNLCSLIGQIGVGEPSVPVATTLSPPQPQPAAASGPAQPPEILILGASGFIGQELARQLLAAGRRIRVLVRNPGRLPNELQGPEVEVVTGDLARAGDLEKAIDGSRFVFHLARANVKTWDEFTQQDVDVTRQIAEACLSKGIQRLIYTGTIDSYYAGSKAGTITEATPLDPYIAWRNLYARAKAASEEILMTLHHDRGLPVVIVRPGIVIGRGGSPFHWGIGMWSWNAVCQIWGRGRNPLPLVLVEDVAQALIAAMKTPQIEGESFNLVADTDLTAFDYLKALEDHAGVSFQKYPTPPWKFYAADLVKWIVKQMVRHPDQRKPSYRDWETRTQQARYDCTKARTVLNWNPICDRSEIIRRGIHLPASEFLV